jgi:outer membrane receptor protein involved in Fe transport
LSGLAAGVLFLLVLSSGSAFAQVSGKVQGTVTDQDTGQPLVGAQVVVSATNLGNVTNEDGYYFINNVPVGIQAIQAQYLGYQTLSQEERILAGQTMSVDFALSSEVIEQTGIVVEIEREPLVARDNTISKSRFTVEEIQGLPTSELEDVIELGAGIYETTDRPGRAGGFVVRGGRTTESAIYIDGALVTDFANQQTNTETSRFGVEEVDVITGGFNAEFGNAQSGVVNIVTREGGREFHGNVRYTTDGQFGTDGYDLQELGLAFDAEDLRFDRVGAPEEETCCGFNSLQASIGGPIIPDKLTFFGSVEAEGAADFFPAVAGWNPAGGGFNSDGSTETILPGNRGDRTRGQVKLTAFPVGSAKVSGTYLYSRDQFENYHDLAFNATALGLFQMLSGDATRTKTHDFIVGWDQQLFQTAERNLNLQVRGNFHQTKLFLGTPLSDITAAFLEDAGVDCANLDFCSEADGDAFEEDFLNYRIDDVDFFFEDAIPSDQRLLNVPTLRSTRPDPIFGVPQIFGAEGFDDGFIGRNERRYGLRVDLDSQLNRVHRIKLGGEYTWINLAERNGLFTSATFASFYDVDPRLGAVYAQDRLDYGDLVIDLGLRVDHWDPNTMFPRFAGVVPCEISAFDQCSDPATNPLAQLVEGQTRTELSPRLGVAHPITDATQVRLSYGKFHQLPELRRYFDGFTTDFVAAAQNPNILYGNPNLDYIETTAFEAGITHLLSENLVLDVVGYNRDRRGALRVDVFQPGTIAPGIQERRIAVNADNGNVKGVDITISRRYSNYYSFDAAYSMQFARGTTSGPTEFATAGGFGRLFDPLFPGRLLTPPTELLAESFDRTHTMNLQFSFRFPDDYREGTGLGTALQDFGAYFIYNTHSGEPFTRRSTVGQGEALEDLNTSRLQWFHQGDVRFVKGLDLGGALDLELFASVINFLDIENVLLVNPSSGRPDATGFEDAQSQTPVIPNDFLTEGAPETFPFNLQTDIVEDFRDEIAQQDRNGDGIVSLQEAQLALREAKQATGDGADFIAGNNGDSVFNYGEPRQYRFGVELRF